METKKIEVNIRIPNLTVENARRLIRGVRHTLENAAKLGILDEFVETREVQNE